MIILYISGIDGCGKTTQSTLLVEWLQQQGCSAEYQWFRWEPSVLPVIRRFRKATHKTDKVAASDTVRATADKTSENRAHGSWRGLKSRLMSSALFRALWLKYATHDYYAAYKKVRRQWTSDYVVMDRYLMDFVVDQSLNFNQTPAEFLETTRTTPLSKLQKPTFSVFINIKAETGYHRKQDGTSLRYLEERESLYNTFQGDDILHINGEQAPEIIHEQIVSWLAPKLGIGYEK